MARLLAGRCAPAAIQENSLLEAHGKPQYKKYARIMVFLLIWRVRYRFRRTGINHGWQQQGRAEHSATNQRLAQQDRMQPLASSHQPPIHECAPAWRSSRTQWPRRPVRAREGLWEPPPMGTLNWRHLRRASIGQPTPAPLPEPVVSHYQWLELPLPLLELDACIDQAGAQFSSLHLTSLDQVFRRKKP